MMLLFVKMLLSALGSGVGAALMVLQSEKGTRGLEERVKKLGVKKGAAIRDGSWESYPPSTGLKHKFLNEFRDYVHNLDNSRVRKIYELCVFLVSREWSILEELQLLQSEFPNLTIITKAIILEAVREDGWALEFAGERFINDFDVALAAMKSYGCVLFLLPHKLRENVDIVNAAVSSCGAALEYGRVELTEEIMWSAVSEDTALIKDVDKENCGLMSSTSNLNLWEDDDDYVNRLGRLHPEVGKGLKLLIEIDPFVLERRDLVLKAVNSHPVALAAAIEYLNDPEIVDAALASKNFDILDLGSIAMELPRDYNDVISLSLFEKAVSVYPCAYAYLGKLKHDREFTLKMIGEHPNVIAYTNAFLNFNHNLSNQDVEMLLTALKTWDNSEKWGIFEKLHEAVITAFTETSWSDKDEETKKLYEILYSNPPLEIAVFLLENGHWRIDDDNLSGLRANKDLMTQLAKQESKGAEKDRKNNFGGADDQNRKKKFDGGKQNRIKSVLAGRLNKIGLYKHAIIHPD